MLRKLLVLLSFILFSLISFHANAELILSCSTQTTVVTSKSQMVASPSQYVIFNNCKTPGYSTTTYGPYLLSGIDNMPGSTYVIKYAITNQCNEETGCQLFFELQPNPIQILSCGPNPQNLSCGSVPSPSNSDVVVNNPSILDYIVIEIEGPTLISCGEKYTVIYSAVDIYGYKDICSRTINVMCPCPEKWCTQTQETYGGNTNFVCSNNTQLQLIQDLSGHAIGRVAQNRSFTFHTWDFLCTHYPSRNG